MFETISRSASIFYEKALMLDTTFGPGIVIANRSRSWHVDAHEDDILVATSIDGGQAVATSIGHSGASK